MSAPESTPTIYCDLIKEEPMTLADYRDATLAQDDTFGTQVTAAGYREYVAHFQPWRIIVLSGDNHEPLFRSTERYFNEADARHAVELAFGCGSNVYLRQAEHGNVELRLASGG